MKNAVPPFELRAQALAHKFERRTVWSNISFTLANSVAIGITGHNGSGKTTLLRVLAGVLTPSAGTVEFVYDGKNIPSVELPRYVGFVSPYLAVYEEFSPLELLRLTAQMRGLREYISPKATETFSTELLETVRLHERRNDEIRRFSSGMKQRMKYALALLAKPALLLLDEPMTNLDADGIAIVERIIKEQCSRGGGVILATNDARDKELCHELISVAP